MRTFRNVGASHTRHLRRSHPSSITLALLPPNANELDSARRTFPPRILRQQIAASTAPAAPRQCQVRDFVDSMTSGFPASPPRRLSQNTRRTAFISMASFANVPVP